MATIAPHPSRPRTRDDNDPFVIKDRAYCLAYMRRMRLEKPEDFLRKKAEYNKRHSAHHAAYAKQWYQAKKAAKAAAMEAENQGPVVSVM